MIYLFKAAAFENVVKVKSQEQSETHQCLLWSNVCLFFTEMGDDHSPIDRTYIVRQLQGFPNGGWDDE